MIGPELIDDGCVVIDGDGRVMAVGSTRELRPPRIDVEIDGLLAPGLVNAHTHLELSDRTAGDPPANGFAGWLAGMLARTRNEAGEMERLVALGVDIGVEQCLRFGVTAVGDISRQCHLTRPLLAASPLRVVSFGEVQAMAQRRGLLAERLTCAVDATHATERLHIGLTPHAPYSVEPNGYRACLDAARRSNLPLATHLAETADEAAFLSQQTGPLRELWDTWLTFDEHVPRHVGGPIDFARSLGLLDFPTLLAHVNYADRDDMALLAAGRASVVWCPRTHTYFGHPPHPWRAMRERGIRVCVGTDSCASSPDLNLMDDLRLVRRQNPDLSASTLWPLVTSEAADALRWGDGLGRLTPGAWADLTSWPTRSDHPLAEVLDTPGMVPSGVWIGGAAPVPSPGTPGEA
jgi:cytosine/adenosine deaminase-related metal-dependent hydrolase